METQTLGAMPALYTSPAAVAAAETAKAEVQAAFVMAMHRPRSAEQARQNILKLCKKPDFAESVEYSKPVGNTKITGLSVRFAEQALREWGNVRTTQRVTYEDDTVRRIMVKVLDLENNAEFSREISVSKTVERKNGKGREVLSERKNSYGDTVYIVAATDDEVATKEAAAVAKVIRNEGLRLLPPDLKEEALETARKTLRDRDAQDPDTAMRKITDGFAALGVTVAMLEKFLGHPVAQSSPAEIEDMRKMYRSIKDGESRWSDYMIDAEAQPAAADPTDALKAAHGRARGHEGVDHKRAALDLVQGAAQLLDGIVKLADLLTQLLKLHLDTCQSFALCLAHELGRRAGLGREIGLSARHKALERLHVGEGNLVLAHGGDDGLHGRDADLERQLQHLRHDGDGCGGVHYLASCTAMPTLCA